MATLTALKFNTAGGAESMIGRLGELQAQELITIQDGAIVTWEEGKKKPKTRELNDLKGAGMLSGAFWGMLFGLLFFAPLIGMAIGAVMGRVTGGMADIGINDDFIDSVRQEVTPGTSALFLLTSNAVEDRVQQALSDFDFKIVATNLSADEEAALREAFEQEDD